MPDLTQSGAPQQKKGKGCFIALAVVGVLAVLAIAGVVGVGMWIKSKVDIATDPAEIVAISDKIATINLGDSWKPQFGMDIMIIRMAFYASGNNAENGVMFLMDGDSNMGTGDQFEAQMRAKMDEQSSRSGNLEGTKQVSSGRQDFMVKGEPISFLVVTSEGVETGAKYLELSGSFKVKEAGRTGFLYLRAPEAAMTLEQAKAIIESIQ